MDFFVSRKGIRYHYGGYILTDEIDRSCPLVMKVTREDSVVPHSNEKTTSNRVHDRHGAARPPTHLPFSSNDRHHYKKLS